MSYSAMMPHIKTLAILKELRANFDAKRAELDILYHAYEPRLEKEK
jgi:hypothetical protein